MQTITIWMYKQWSPTVQPLGLYPFSWDKIWWKIVREKECVWGASLCCIAEIDTTLWINYTLIKKIKKKRNLPLWKFPNGNWLSVFECNFHKLMFTIRNMGSLETDTIVPTNQPKEWDCSQSALRLKSNHHSNCLLGGCFSTQ